MADQQPVEQVWGHNPVIDCLEGIGERNLRKNSKYYKSATIKVVHEGREYCKRFVNLCDGCADPTEGRAANQNSNLDDWDVIGPEQKRRRVLNYFHDPDNKMFFLKKYFPKEFYEEDKEEDDAEEVAEDGSSVSTSAAAGADDDDSSAGSSASNSSATPPEEEEEEEEEDDDDSSKNTDGSDETEDDADADNNPGASPEAEAEAAVGGVAGGGTAVDSAVAEMRQEIMEIIQDAMAEEDDDAEFDLLMHIVTEVGREDSIMYGQIVTNAGRPEATRMSAASLYAIVEKIGKHEMKREG